MNCTVADAIKEIEKNTVGLSEDQMQELEAILQEIQGSKTIGSDEDSSISKLEEFTKEYSNIQNDPKKMVDLFNALGSDDKVQPSESHKKKLEEVLKVFVDESEQYIQETTIKIAEKYKGKNEGAYSIGKNEIYLGISINEPESANAMSIQEVFVHEVIHAAVEHAKNDNKAEVVHALHMIDQMYDQASKIQPNENLSKETLDYIFNKDIDKKHHGVSEFIAYALTHEAFMKELEKLDVIEQDKKADTFSEWVAIWFKKLINAVFRLERGAIGLTIDAGVMKFSLELARANNLAGKEVQRTILSRITEAVNDLDAKIAQKMKDITQPIEDKNIYEIYGTYGRLGGTLLAPVKFWKDKEMKDRLLTYLDKTGWWIFDKRNSFQTITRDLRDTDSYNMIIQKMGYNSGNVERAKKEREGVVIKLAREGFKELSREEDTALGHTVIETDMTVLMEYTGEEIIGFLQDDKLIDAEATKLLESLDASERTKNAYQYKLEDLGHYMATGMSRIENTMLNTKTIANLTEGGSMEHMETMDKIVSLMAIKNTSKASRDITAEIMQKQEDGVRGLMILHKAVKDSAKEMLFSKESDYLSSNYIQGYTRDILNPDMDTKVAPANEVEKMLKEGYRRVEILPKSKYDTSGMDMAVYVSNEAARQPWHRQMLSIVDKGRRGTTFTEVHLAAHGQSGYLSAEKNIEAYKKAVKIAEEQMLDGTYKRPGGIMPIPVRNLNGKIMDVRYTMSKVNKVKYLQRDSRATTMLGRTDSTGLEKVLSEKFNLDAIDIIIDDMRKNMTDEKKDEYIEISKNSTDPEVKEMYMILPEYLKRHMEDSLVDENGEVQNLWVRKDVYRQIFGYRGFTLDVWAREKEAYRAVRYVIRVAEMMWKAIVSMFKVVIVIKTPAVLIGNIMSNFLYSLMVGIPLNEVYRGHMDAIEALNQYQKDSRELDRLKIQDKMHPSKEKEAKIRDLQHKMKASPIADMMEEGLFTAIIEDVEAAELEDPNRLARKVDEFMENMPQFVRTGADWLWITKRSPMFKIATKATQYSDFISRYTLMEHYKKIGVQAGLSAKQARDIAMSEAIEAFINYDMADSKMLQYANEMGLAMFTKYMLRIQRVWRKGVVNHPIQFVSAILGQAVLFDFSDITDSALFINKDPMDNIGLDMVEKLSTVLSPPSLELMSKWIK